MMEQPNCQITGVSFRLFDQSEARKLSVLSIDNPQTFDPLGHPFDHGLADTALGPLKRNDFCKTCGLTDNICLGHFGHIQLPLPVFNPFLMTQLFKVLKMFCFKCHYLLFSPFQVEVYIAQLRALNYGLDFILDDILEYSNEIAQTVKGFDWTSYEGQCWLRAKFTSMINQELCKVKGSASKEKMLELEDMNEDELAQLETVEVEHSKNVIERKQQLFKDFLGGKLLKMNKLCTRCSARKAPINVINKSLFIQSMPRGAKLQQNSEADNPTENDEIRVEMKGKSYLTPSQAREHLRKLWQNERDTLLRLFPFLNIEELSSEASGSESCPLDVFFWETIIVSPNRFRPLRALNGRSFEHYKTTALNELMLVARSLEHALEVAKKSNSGDAVARFHAQWQRVQILCNRLYDANMDKLPDNKAVGLKQILEKKEGLLRKNMMGKRVNFAARSVISPDPYIMVDEIGIPVIFAAKLSYPQPVTNWNVKQLQEMVVNGPMQYPGALSVTYEDGFTIRLKPDDLGQRRSVAANLHAPTLGQGLNGVKVVNRHLLTGDVLLLNRQPTLHKPSIMAHKARVLPKEKTIRLHYANCKCYNADFDGDEMNAHFPQSELARAEAYNIASVNYQFLVPKDGSPLSGLIQDHIIAGVLLTVRGKFFNKSDYQELVFGALSFLDRPIKLLPPTIWKPEKLWSGKQIISTLVVNLIPEGKPLPSFEIECKISHKMFVVDKPRECALKEKEMCESQVIFRHGELLCGLMDKTNFGANKNGLIHICYELYGGDVHSRLLTAIARLSTNFLQSYHGFTLGIHDILVRPKPNQKRRKLIKQSFQLGYTAVSEAFNLDISTLDEYMMLEKLQFAHTNRQEIYMKQLDAAYKQQTDELSNLISGTCLPKGLIKQFPDNNLQMMIQAGAKGGSVNAIQISCLLGQIELEGRRIPLMMSGRTLPSFRPYDTQPRAGGFVTGRFLTGIRPQEFFFHCMAGREGLIDTAVKTSRSGYLQRCLIKHLEGLVVNYDLTVRDSEGSVVQWLYGEDGLDVIRSQALKKPFFPTILQNRDALKSSAHEITKLKSIQDPTMKQEIHLARKYLKELKNSKERGNSSSPFLTFQKEFEQNNLNMQLSKKDLTDAWYALDDKSRYGYYMKKRQEPDPVLAKFRPDLNLGSISETLDQVIEGYVSENLKNRKSKSEIREFKETLNVCYMRALANPGEAVGLLAAQSIGEPSTQMTLNTFHFAGRGEMNVTLGVPRLRELLMTASAHISNPSMDLPFRTDLEGVNLEVEAEKVRLRLNAVRLKDVIEYVDITETLEIGTNESYQRYRVYKVKFVFLPRSYYKRRCFTNAPKILAFLESTFIRQFIEAINRRIRQLTKASGLFDSNKMSRSRNTAAKKKTIEGDEEDMLAEGDFGDLEEPKSVTSVLDELDDDEEDLDDYDVDEGEGDTTAMRQWAKINQEREYEEPEQEEVEMAHGGDEDEDELEESNNNNKSKDQVIVKTEILSDEEEVEDFCATPIRVSSVLDLDENSRGAEEPKSELEAQLAERRAKVIQKSPSTIVDYNFDTEKQLWCEVTLRFDLIAAKLDLRSIVEEEAGKAYVHRIGKVDRAFLVKDLDAAKKEASFAQMVKTEGVSLAHMVEFERYLDLRRVYTNDMHAVANTYGIEAARAAIIREISYVFGVYGISVDGRHLSLIADHMTFTGKIKGMNRGAMDGISPLQAMTFETTTNFMKNSLLLDINDDLQSPSSRLVIGRPTVVGTGLFETRLNPQLVSGLVSPNITFSTSVFNRSLTRSSTSSFLGLGRRSRGISSASFLATPSASQLKTRKRPSSEFKEETSPAEPEVATQSEPTFDVAKRIKLEYDSN